MIKAEAEEVMAGGFYIRICRGGNVAFLTFPKAFWLSSSGLDCVPWVSGLVKKHVPDYDSFAVYENGVAVRGCVVSR